MSRTSPLERDDDEMFHSPKRDRLKVWSAV
jgi:hypothetical protein